MDERVKMYKKETDEVIDFIIEKGFEDARTRKSKIDLRVMVDVIKMNPHLAVYIAMKVIALRGEKK